MRTPTAGEMRRRLQHWINLLSLKEIGIGASLWYPLQWICPD